MSSTHTKGVTKAVWRAPVLPAVAASRGVGACGVDQRQEVGHNVCIGFILDDLVPEKSMQ